METIEYTLPAYWAVALMYGDYSGLSPEEVDDIDQFFKSEDCIGNCVDVRGEPFFTNWHDAGSYGVDCLEYVFEVD